MSRVLLVGGDAELRDILQRFLEVDGHDVDETGDDLKAVACLANARPRYDLLILCSILLRPFDIGTLLRCIKPLVEHRTPVILATGALREEVEAKLPKNGVRPYAVLRKPFELRDLLRLLKRALLDMRIRHVRATLAAARGDWAQGSDVELDAAELFQLRSGVSLMLLDVLDKRAGGLRDHALRVERHAWKLGMAIGLDSPELAATRSGALLHDVGKIVLPDRLLQHHRPEVQGDRARVLDHGVEGAELLRWVSLFGDCVEIVHHHHERFDGAGYPQRLRADQIPIGARICAVVDAFDNACEGWRGREPRGIRFGIRAIEAEAGGALDPNLVRAFRSVVQSDIAPSGPGPGSR